MCRTQFTTFCKIIVCMGRGLMVLSSHVAFACLVPDVLTAEEAEQSKEVRKQSKESVLSGSDSVDSSKTDSIGTLLIPVYTCMAVGVPVDTWLPGSLNTLSPVSAFWQVTHVLLVLLKSC